MGAPYKGSNYSPHFSPLLKPQEAEPAASADAQPPIGAINTTLWGAHDLSRYYPLYQTNAEWQQKRLQEEHGAKIFTAHTQFCSALWKVQQKPSPHSSISFNFARSGPLCEQLSAHLISTGTVLWFGRRDSNQHKNVLHIHRPHSVNA